MAAQVAFDAIFTQMKSERDAAIRAFTDEAALIANQRSGEASPVQEQDGLFLPGQPRFDRASETARDERNVLLLKILLPHIDHANQWKLAVIDSGNQVDKSILPGRRVLVALQRWSRAPKKNRALVDLGSHDGKVACVIPWRLLLLVGSLVLLVNNDQPEALNRSKHRAARANRDSRSATV